MIAPYPWHCLPAVSLDEMARVRALRQLSPTIDVASIASAVRALAAVSLAVDPASFGEPSRLRADRPLGSWGNVVVVGSKVGVFAVEIEAAVALRLLDAVTGGGKKPSVARSAALDGGLAGALGGVVIHLARHAGLVDAQRLHLDPSPRQLARALGVDGVLSIDAPIALDGLRAHVRIDAALHALAQAPRRHDRSLLRAIDAVPLELHAVIAIGRLAVAELATLSFGDTIAFDDRTPDAARAACCLMSGDARQGVPAARVDASSATSFRRIALAIDDDPVDKRFAMRRPSRDDTASTETLAAVGTEPELDALAEQLAEVPVTVRAEIGVATMPARAWAEIGTGDVIELDRRVGDPIELVVGGTLIARGELVDVKGTLGVRVTERIKGRSRS